MILIIIYGCSDLIGKNPQNSAGLCLTKRPGSTDYFDFFVEIIKFRRVLVARDSETIVYITRHLESRRLPARIGRWSIE